MRILVASILLSGLTLSSHQAVAAESLATLQSVQGKVLVNHGNGYEKAEDATAIVDGDVIMLGPDATATVAFTDGSCDVPLLSKKITHIIGNLLCQTAQLRGSNEDVLITPVNYIAPVVLPTIVPTVVVGTFVVVAGTVLTTAVLLNTTEEAVSAP